MTTAMVAGFADMLIKSAHVAFNRGDWVEAERIAAELRDIRQDKPHGYVIGAKATYWLGRYAQAEDLFHEALARFPNDNWVLQDWLWMLQERSRWAEAVEVADRIMQRTTQETPLYRIAFRTKFRALKTIDETAIDDETVLEAIRLLEPGARGLPDVIDVCLRRRTFPLARQVWDHIAAMPELDPSQVSLAAKKLFHVFHEEPEAELFVSWVFRTQPRDPKIFWAISVFRYLRNSTDIVPTVRPRLAAIYEALDPATVDPFMRASVGSYFGDLLDESEYAALFIELIPLWAAIDIEENPLNNIVYFADDDALHFANGAERLGRIRAAFASAVSAMLGTRLVLPEHAPELFYLLLAADNIAHATYERIFWFVEAHVASLADSPREGAAGALRTMVERRRRGVVPAIAKRKPKVCVELSAQVRGYRRAFETWHRLGLDDCETVYVGHLWNKVGRRVPWAPHSAGRTFAGHFLPAYVRTLGEQGFEYIRVQYPSLYAAVTSSDALDEDDVRDLYKPVALEVESSDQPRFQGRRPSVQMYYSWWRSHQMALEHAGDADIFIRIRPDLYFTDDVGIDWRDFARRADAENMIYVQFPRRFLSIGGAVGMGDQIAIGGPRGIGAYVDAFVETEAAYAGKRYGFPKKWTGHENCAYSTFLHAVRGVAHPKLPDNHPLYDPPTFRADAILAWVETDIAGRTPTAVDEAWVAALRADL